MTDEPVLPRYRKAPKRFNEGAQPHRYTSPEERYCQAYFEVLDLAGGEIEKPTTKIFRKFQKLLPNISEERLIWLMKIQLPMLPDAISTAFAGSLIRVQKVTNVRTIADTFNQSEIVKGMLSEVDKLLRGYLTFPVTSATAERSFSSLRRIKTFLRSTMTHQRLNNLFLLYVHTAQTESLDLVAVAKEFVSANSRRLNYFGKF